ncbi:hypothetical protein GCM10023335_59150 [Streptomyces siamensis]|uniref:Uncharacterized protein n=1 Tax=Streptomyces siamensis TaxID=1274986 RepID=A0ABP9JBB8_9ACTN
MPADVRRTVHTDDGPTPATRRVSLWPTPTAGGPEGGQPAGYAKSDLTLQGNWPEGNILGGTVMLIKTDKS